MAEPAIFRIQLAQPLSQRPVIQPRRLATDRPLVHTNQCTRPTLVHPVMLPEMGDHFPLGAGRYHFSCQMLREARHLTGPAVSKGCIKRRTAAKKRWQAGADVNQPICA